MNFQLDTNILVYAFDPAEPAKQAIARRVFEHAAGHGGTIARQVLGEFLALSHRRGRASPADVRTIVTAIEATMTVIDTDAAETLAASELAERYRLSYFDALIGFLACRAGASVLLSEDMQDGLRIDALTIVNPFAAANADIIAGLTA